MMRSNKRKLSLCLVWIILLIGFAGCGKLAREEGASPAMMGDKLIGGYVTTQALHEKVYGELSTMNENGHEFVECTFDGIDGVHFVVPDVKDEYAVMVFDDEVADAHYSVNRTDDVNIHTILEGTVYYSKNVTFYLNPVYQEKDGDVYMLPDKAVFVGASSRGLKESYNDTYNGSTGEMTMEVNVKFEYKPQTEDIRLVYMDDKDCVISTEEFGKTQIPEKISVNKNVQYILLECNGSESYRELMDRNDDGFLTYHEAKGDICVGQKCELIWE
ncbi:MAG: hypothetical protein IJB96_05905 [Lachnospira sp.]|nr:hypothetical protein [Lachnospira sp.]